MYDFEKHNQDTGGHSAHLPIKSAIDKQKLQHLPARFYQACFGLLKPVSPNLNMPTILPLSGRPDKAQTAEFIKSEAGPRNLHL